MLKKWVCFEAQLGGQIQTFVGKIDYPFAKSIGAPKPKGVLCFENLMVKSADGFIRYPAGVEGVTGQVFFRHDLILTYSPLKDSKKHWETCWNETS